MSAWFIIDDLTTKRAVLDVSRCEAQTKDEAILEAKRIWNALSAHDQQQRDAFYVCCADEDNDGEIMTRDVFNLKDMKG